MKELFVHYTHEHNYPIQKSEGNAGIDLYAYGDYKLKQGEFALIDLGVVIKLPEDTFAFLLPRSSTFKKWGIIQTNSAGIIDETYCGKDDVWKMPVLAMRDTEIHSGDKIAQLIVSNCVNNTFTIEEKYIWDIDKNRGGFGSTGSSFKK